jgi:hypothetical protein
LFGIGHIVDREQTTAGLTRQFHHIHAAILAQNARFARGAEHRCIRIQTQLGAFAHDQGSNRAAPVAKRYVFYCSGGMNFEQMQMRVLENKGFHPRLLKHYIAGSIITDDTELP